MKYHSPCETCTRTNCKNLTCKPYRQFINTMWKQFGGYPARAYRAYRQKLKTEDKFFIYEHPDVVRRYLENGPCSGCPREKECDTPCFDYWCWWDARREWLKGVWGM